MGLNVNDLFSEDRELLIWRTGISQMSMTTVCQHRYEGYILKYEKYNYFVCSDPLHQHSSKIVKKQLRTLNIIYEYKIKILEETGFIIFYQIMNIVQTKPV